MCSTHPFWIHLAGRLEIDTSTKAICVLPDRKRKTISTPKQFIEAYYNRTCHTCLSRKKQQLQISHVFDAEGNKRYGCRKCFSAEFKDYLVLKKLTAPFNSQDKLKDFEREWENAIGGEIREGLASEMKKLLSAKSKFYLCLAEKFVYSDDFDDVKMKVRERKNEIEIREERERADGPIRRGKEIWRWFDGMEMIPEMPSGTEYDDLFGEFVEKGVGKMDEICEEFVRGL
jgi:hypothetical protein